MRTMLFLATCAACVLGVLGIFVMDSSRAMAQCNEGEPVCQWQDVPADGRSISVPLAWYPRLLHASIDERNNWRVAGGGYGIHWPDLDEDLSTEGLLRGAPAPTRRSPAQS
jgi:hypothetical protein